MRRPAPLAWAASLLVVVLAPSTASAQDRPAPRAEVRVDATSSHEPRLEASAGVAIPLGTYVRLAMLAGGGIVRDGAGGNGAAARGDLIARFQLDPFRQQRRGVYGGGGLSFQQRTTRSGTIYFALMAGVETTAIRGVTPAFEVALGGGLRIGVALRQTGRGWR